MSTHDDTQEVDAEAALFGGSLVDKRAVTVSPPVRTELNTPDGSEFTAYIWNVTVDGVLWKFAWAPHDRRLFLQFQLNAKEWSRFVPIARTIVSMDRAIIYISQWAHWRAHATVEELARDSRSRGAGLAGLPEDPDPPS